MEKTDNELIAEFMGARWQTFSDGQAGFTFWHADDTPGRYGSFPDGSTNKMPDALDYDTSWDWLMPVVEKIEHFGHAVLIEDNYCRVTMTETKKDDIRVWTINKKIEAVYSATVQFIKWYNTQKQ